MPHTAVANSRVLGLLVPKVSKLRKGQYLELAHKAALLASSLNTALYLRHPPTHMLMICAYTLKLRN